MQQDDRRPHPHPVPSTSLGFWPRSVSRVLQFRNPVCLLTFSGFPFARGAELALGETATGGGGRARGGRAAASQTGRTWRRRHGPEDARRVLARGSQSDPAVEAALRRQDWPLPGLGVRGWGCARPALRGKHLFSSAVL